MPDPRDDLVRRGDVLNALHKIPIVRLIDESEIKTGEEEMFAALPADQAIDRTEDAVQAIPADPVAAAAVALAEKIHPHIVDISEDGPLYGCCACSREWRDVESHEPHCALAAYRAALAGREPRP